MKFALGMVISGVTLLFSYETLGDELVHQFKSPSFSGRGTRPVGRAREPLRTGRPQGHALARSVCPL